MTSRRLVLFMDVNKTIVLFDGGNDTSASQNILAHLGRSTTHAWDSTVSESFFSYVRRVLAPGNEVVDPVLKKHRQGLDTTLLERFADVPGGLDIKARYDAMLVKLSDMQERKRIILPSFQRLLAELQRQSHGVSYSVVLRSFGPDVSEAFQEIVETNPHLSIGTFGMFSKGQLHTLPSLEQVAAIYSQKKQTPLDELLLPHPKVDLFAATAALQPFSIGVWSDDYSYWHGNGEKSIGGKPFPIMNHPTTVFFDDNATEKEIIAPIPSPDYSGGVRDGIVNVDPVLALEHDDYFVRILQGMHILQ